MADKFERKSHTGGRTEVFPKSVIQIHRGLHIVVELRGDSVFIGVGDSYDSKLEQIAYVEQGPNMVVVRAMRDALTDLLGDGGREHDDKHAVALRTLLKMSEEREYVIRGQSGWSEAEEIIRRTLGLYR